MIAELFPDRDILPQLTEQVLGGIEEKSEAQPEF
jgi:hypothetical protein